jgi:signal transduction histidine kinase
MVIGLIGFFSSRATTSEFERYVERDFLSYERLVNPYILLKLDNFLQFRRIDCDQSAETFLECQSQPVPYTQEILTEFQALVRQLATISGTHIVVADSDGRMIANSVWGTSAAEDSFDFAAASGVFLIDGQPFLVYIDLTEESGLGASQNAFLSSVNQSLIITLVAAGAAALLIVVLLSRRILQPISVLTQAARTMGLGDLSQRVPVSSRDEIGELGQAFNAMADGLSRLEKLRRNMVSDVAHELRTPLSNVRGYLEAIQDGLTDPRPHIIDSLHEEVMLLSRLVDDLQELALAEAGQLQLKRVPISLEDIIIKAQNGLKPTIIEKELEVELHLPSNLPLLEVDPERIGQVLRNLLSNAATYTPTGGKITVVAKVIEEGVQVIVSDSGIGIAEEHLSFVFERFYRVDESRTRSTGGAGLGLAIVKQLIQAHGGHIEIDSRINSGTTIRFTLPTAVGS